MKKIAKFEKVSFEQFKKDYTETFSNDYNLKNIFNDIKLPHRATQGSAGYDFYLPIDITLRPNETIKIPTGIKAKINTGWFLGLFPRSSLGFKYRLQLNNTVGIIDSDYYNNKNNEGHIFIKLTNRTNESKVIELKKGDAFAQGIFLEFGITEDDNSNETRIGGMGSTN